MPTHARFSARSAALACALLLGTPASVNAQAVNATFAGPSIVRFSDDAQFTGRGFTPNSQVTIVVTVPAGDEIRDRAAVADDGTLSVTYSIQAPGQYVLRVMNDAGETLASAHFLGTQ